MPEGSLYVLSPAFAVKVRVAGIQVGGVIQLIANSRLTSYRARETHGRQ